MLQGLFSKFIQLCNHHHNLVSFSLIYLFFKKYLFYLFIYFWLRWVFVAARGLSLVAASRGYSSLWCAGFSLRWLLLLRSTGSRCAGFSSCGTRALESRLSSCGAQVQLFHGMWDLPRPGLEPVSPALAGGFLTTAPPGKPYLFIFNSLELMYNIMCRCIPQSSFRTFLSPPKIPSSPLRSTSWLPHLAAGNCAFCLDRFAQYSLSFFFFFNIYIYFGRALRLSACWILVLPPGMESCAGNKSAESDPLDSQGILFFFNNFFSV